MLAHRPGMMDENDALHIPICGTVAPPVTSGGAVVSGTIIVASGEMCV
jgi:hypothetical protein